jgi:hypothetical protein
VFNREIATVEHPREVLVAETVAEVGELEQGLKQPGIAEPGQRVWTRNLGS